MKHTTCISVGLLLIPVILIFYAAASEKECSKNSDCLHINGSICSDGNCTCPALTVLATDPKDNATYCLRAFNLTEGNCTFNEQCTYDHGMCLKDRTCGCEVKFVALEGICHADERKSIVPIAVGITIGVAVFATLCLYMFLSRKKE